MWEGRDSPIDAEKHGPVGSGQECRVEAQVEAEPDEAEVGGQAGVAGAVRRGLGRGLGAILPARASLPLELVGLGTSRALAMPSDVLEPAERTLDGPPRTRLSTPSELVAGLDRALVAAGAGGGLVAVVVLGVDGFRHVNAAFGRQAGDAMLEALGERLVRSRRRGDLVSRLHGDEFAVVCPRVDRALGARRAVERVIAEFDAPLVAGEHSHRLQASFGLALNISGEPDDSAQVLLGRAELAMRRAKETGLRWAVFTPQRDGYQLPRWKTSGELRRGLDDEGDGGSSPPGSPRSTAPR
jgi:diguanylate cyclase (GGDEF)-like protein